MKYIGKLYGKLGGKTFDTGYTSEDYDKLIQSLKESTDQCSRQQLTILELENDKLDLMEEIQMLKRKVK